MSQEESSRLLVSVMEIEMRNCRTLEFKIAFLNGNFKKKMYMEQPKGLIDLGNPDWVCGIMCLLYSSKQHPKYWNQELHRSFAWLDLTQSWHDLSIHLQNHQNTLNGLIVTYFNNLAVTGMDKSMKVFRRKINQQFKSSMDKPLAANFISTHVHWEPNSTEKSTSLTT